ncbi:hypothetical protein NHQ30_011147 [Ciborinia camelliae]|nr:hypothetical protein NHQ30_011147 [Ciborinia camelliae]
MQQSSNARLERKEIDAKQVTKLEDEAENEFEAADKKARQVVDVVGVDRITIKGGYTQEQVDVLVKGENSRRSHGPGAAFEDKITEQRAFLVFVPSTYRQS